jgi:hypothetical protein
MILVCPVTTPEHIARLLAAFDEAIQVLTR